MKSWVIVLPLKYMNVSKRNKSWLKKLLVCFAYGDFTADETMLQNEKINSEFQTCTQKKTKQIFYLETVRQCTKHRGKNKRLANMDRTATANEAYQKILDQHMSNTEAFLVGRADWNKESFGEQSNMITIAQFSGFKWTVSFRTWFVLL